MISWVWSADWVMVLVHLITHHIYSEDFLIFCILLWSVAVFVLQSFCVFIFFASSLSSVPKGHRGPGCRKHQYGKLINFFCCCNLWAIFLIITWYKERISSHCLLSAPFRLVRSASLSHTRDERRTLIPRSLPPKRNFLPPKTSHWLQGPHVRQVTSVWCMVGGAAKKKLVCVW